MRVFISWKCPTVSGGKVEYGRNPKILFYSVSEKKPQGKPHYHSGHHYHTSDGLVGVDPSRKSVRPASLDGKNRYSLARLAVRPVSGAGLGEPENLAKDSTAAGIPRNIDTSDGSQPAVYPVV
ncbi:hypothetical protein Xentx_03342 [Xenorhabdus thuongxuanensis]|uniref:Uncharacterized protein n=1 Tax=Xenorhabdus thuongxuanensis TaxID=1873484 RepID=A0A1Q5TNI3_9GAMM|nr:hypothetical protein Xentx_03342 [Xenorhabdus thuongxuanensis]